MKADKLYWSVASEDEADASGKGDPFVPVTEYGSKNRKKDAKSKKKENKRKAIKEQLAGFFSWSSFCEDALPETLVDSPHDFDEAVDHSEDGEERNMGTAGFAVAKDLGSTEPVSKLPEAPPGAAEKAKQRMKQGRGLEGGGTAPAPALSHEPVDPSSVMDNFNWDHMPVPGLGQV